jgi:hypothetical protein
MMFFIHVTAPGTVALPLADSEISMSLFNFVAQKSPQNNYLFLFDNKNVLPLIKNCILHFTF